MKNTDNKASWFESWFNSKYYHMLYSKRDNLEAEEFIKRMTDFLQCKKGASVLDLACGKGRHSIALHKKGLKVTGIDLSEKSIVDAKQNETEGLSFFVHDMRLPFMINYFNFTFNLFTSFGYFSSIKENLKVVKAVSSGLKADGIFVIDFLNAKLVNEMVSNNCSGVITENGIDFHWKKRIENKVVLKDITFEAEQKLFNYTESVQLLEYSDFEKLLSPYFTIEHVFGDYSLGVFDYEKSPRLIIIAKKNKA